MWACCCQLSTRCSVTLALDPNLKKELCGAWCVAHSYARETTILGALRLLQTALPAVISFLVVISVVSSLTPVSPTKPHQPKTKCWLIFYKAWGMCPCVSGVCVCLGAFTHTHLFLWRRCLRSVLQPSSHVTAGLSCWSDLDQFLACSNLLEEIHRPEPTVAKRSDNKMCLLCSGHAITFLLCHSRGRRGWHLPLWRSVPWEISHVGYVTLDLSEGFFAQWLHYTRTAPQN